MSELIDREALLDECLNHYEAGNIEQNCTMDWICKTVRNFPAAPRWHRVEEELPPEGVTVWCAIYTTDLIRSMPGESVSEAMMRCQKEAAKHPRCEMGTYYKGEGWSECLFGAPMVCTPKYWCYLPEPPKEDA